MCRLKKLKNLHFDTWPPNLALHGDGVGSSLTGSVRPCVSVSFITVQR